MGRIERFEDIQAWQKARDLNKAIYGITKILISQKTFL